MLKKLAQRWHVEDWILSGVYSDQPDKNIRFLRDIFGNSLEVLKDPFHLLYDYGNACLATHAKKNGVPERYVDGDASA